MDTRSFPTKGNLLLNKSTLALARQGYDLMDKKRNVLITAIVEIIDEIRAINSRINTSFQEAYEALELANVQLGVNTVLDMAMAMPVEDSVQIYTRSVMDSDIPTATYTPADNVPTYPFFATSEALDIARLKFADVKELTIRMAMLENAAFRLSTNINKAQKRANALKNVIIPNYETLVKDITNALEEKEREEFIRLKVIKRNKEKVEE